MRKCKILWYLQQKRGEGGLTARLPLSHIRGATTGHGYDHIARSHSSKGGINRTKQPLGNYVAYVKPESILDLASNHVSTETAQAHFGTDEQRMSKTLKSGRRRQGPPCGQYAMKKNKERIAQTGDLWILA